MVDADVLLACTGSPSTLVDYEQLAAVVEARSHRPLLIVDVAMPRDVDPGGGSLPGVTLLDLADLRQFVETGLGERRREVGRVRAIIAEELARHQDQALARQVAPTVAALHAQAERVRAAELSRYRSRLEGLDLRQREAVEGLTRAILGKLLHGPTTHIKEAAGTPKAERLSDALRELFDL